MEYGPPPLFNQGVSARARLAFFSLVASVLIIVDAQLNVLDVIRNGVGILLYPAQRALLWPRDLAEGIGSYLSMQRTLVRENERLSTQVAELALHAQEAGQLAAENAQLRELAGMRARLTASTLVVRALYESRDPFSHRIVVDRGTQDGLRAGCPVIDEAGVVGQVTRVFPMSAEVTLVTDKEQSLPVQIARNGLHAVAFGGSEAASLELRFLPANIEIEPGDAVVTSGLDGVYPPGLAVATVARIDRDVDKDQFARVILKPVAGTSRSRLLLALLVDPPPPLPSDAEHRDAPLPTGARTAPKASRR